MPVIVTPETSAPETLGGQAVEPRRRFRQLRLIASCGVLVVGLWTAAMAVFTDTADVTSNDFTTGTLDISTAPASAFLTLAAMAPGDLVTAPLTVSNDGTLELRYAMTSSATGDAVLAAALVVEVKSGVTDCTDAGFAADGTTLDAGALGAVSFGDVSQGAQAGDRTLASGASEELCFQVSLPLAADDSLQGLTTEGTFSFVAEQTSNNP